jgi:hypothetical protein
MDDPDSADRILPSRFHGKRANVGRPRAAAPCTSLIMAGDAAFRIEDGAEPVSMREGIVRRPLMDEKFMPLRFDFRGGAWRPAPRWPRDGPIEQDSDAKYADSVTDAASLDFKTGRLRIIAH